MDWGVLKGHSGAKKKVSSRGMKEGTIFDPGGTFQMVLYLVEYCCSNLP